MLIVLITGRPLVFLASTNCLSILSSYRVSIELAPFGRLSGRHEGMGGDKEGEKITHQDTSGAIVEIASSDAPVDRT